MREELWKLGVDKYARSAQLFLSFFFFFSNLNFFMFWFIIHMIYEVDGANFLISYSGSKIFFTRMNLRSYFSSFVINDWLVVWDAYPFQPTRVNPKPVNSFEKMGWNGPVYSTRGLGWMRILSPNPVDVHPEGKYCVDKNEYYYKRES